MSKARRTAFVTTLALIGDLYRDEARVTNACPICAHERNEESACSYCGVYTCQECKKLHYGDHRQRCPGDGVPISVRT